MSVSRHWGVAANASTAASGCLTLLNQVAANFGGERMQRTFPFYTAAYRLTAARVGAVFCHCPAAAFVAKFARLITPSDIAGPVNEAGPIFLN